MLHSSTKFSSTTVHHNGRADRQWLTGEERSMDRSTGSSEEELADSDSNGDSDVYEVEKIVNRRVKPGTSLRYRCIHAAAVSE